MNDLRQLWLDIKDSIVQGPTLPVTDLRLMDADVLATELEDTRPELVNLAARCKTDFARISDLIGNAFFAHTDAPEALVSRARMMQSAEDPR